MDQDTRSAGGIGRKVFPGRFLRGLTAGLSVVALLLGCAGELGVVTGTSTDRSGSCIPDIVVHSSLSAEAGYTDWGNQLHHATSLGIGFVRPEHRHLAPDERPQTEEVRVEDGHVLSWYLILSSGEPTTVLVTVLLDYLQVPFSLDDKEGLLHEVRVDPTGDLELPMHVEIDGPGAHDLLVIAFKEPYDRPLDAEYRDTLHQRLVGRRAVVVVEGVAEPAHQPTPDLIGSPPPPDVTFGIPVSFAQPPDTGTSHPSKRFLHTIEGQPKEVVPYQLWLSNYHGEAAVDYGLVLFQDFHQVFLQGKNLFMVHLDAGHEAIVDSSLTLPPQPGIHELQAVLVFDPYRSIKRGEVADPFVRGSNCLGVQVHQ